MDVLVLPHVIRIWKKDSLGGKDGKEHMALPTMSENSIYVGDPESGLRFQHL